MTKQNETRRERFIRVAESRTNKILDMLKLLGNCANASNYEYSQNDVKRIFDAVDQEVKNAKNKFKAGNLRVKDRFSLND